jgi:hydrogenase nickel incorporation protein HypA/HybF
LHELSLANEVIKIAGYEAGRNNAGLVSEITIEAGIFSGVEIDAFRSALEIVAKDTVLSDASLNIIKIKGQGYCNICDREFQMDKRIDTCPVCNSFPSEIRRGYEFRVVSIVVEKNDEKE